MSSEGDVVGKVAHVLADADDDIFDGLVIDLDKGPGGLHFADADLVGDLYERAAFLKVSSAEVEGLPKPTANPAVMESHADDSESRLAAKLHRAWDLISGNY